ncbi:MAG: tetratricopeptide repeat protein [Planctomycetes bacterium]|nr:tetratricopeptide repeat protein [Planctomycetota bacterium]
MKVPLLTWLAAAALLLLAASPCSGQSVRVSGPVSPEGAPEVDRLRRWIAEDLIGAGVPVRDGAPEEIAGIGRIEGHKIVVEIERRGAGSVGAVATFSRYVRPAPEEILDLFSRLRFELANGRRELLAARSELPEQAKPLLHASTRADPAWAWPWLRLAELQRRQGDLGSALEAARRAVELDPSLGAARNELGVIHLLAGRSDEAAAAFDAGIAADPGFPENYHNLSVVLREKIETERALELARKAVEIRPDYHQAWHSIGSCLYVDGKLAESLEPFRKAVELEPDFHAARVMLGTALFDLARYGESERVFRELLARRENDFAGHYYLGRILARSEEKERLEEGLAHFERFLADGGDDERVKGWIEETRKKLGR